ncbi:universal stress protein [Flexithrix dorotheae]|uniref:universal stress protein n=1 Tax=Flexithrix dorotheae TaxID=70993 RepID=UPI00037ADE6B|nr:universal stress protein [Flexithrix dorotheae]
MEKAIVYFDLTDESKKLVEYVMHLKRLIPLQIHLVYNPVIYDYAFYPVSPAGLYDQSTFIPPITADKQELEERIHEFIDNSSCWGKSELKENLKIETGELFNVIQDYKDEVNATFVIIPEIDERILLEKFFNNEQFKIIEKVDVPVMVVPRDFKFQPFKSIVYATDFHKRDKKAIQFLSRLAIPINAPIHVVHIAESESSETTKNMDKLHKEVQELLQHDAKSINFECFVGDHVTAAVHQFAQEREAGIIALLQQKEGFLARVLGRSTTDKMTKKTNFPILVFNKD